MKKLLVLVLIAALLLLAACGGNREETPEGGAEGTAAGNIDDGTGNDGGNDGPAAGGIGDGSSGAVTLPIEIPVIEKAESYAEAYEQLTAITNAVNAAIGGIIATHDAAIEADDPDGFFENPEYTSIWGFSVLQSYELSFTAILTDDPASLAAVEEVYRTYDMTDVSSSSPKTGQYIISFISDSGEEVTETCTFDTATGSLSYVDTRNGMVTYFYEFINMGDGTYVFQTSYDRALIDYDGTLLSFYYMSVYDYNGFTPFDHAQDSVFPDGSGVNESWVFARGTDKAPVVYRFDGTTLIIGINDEFDGKRNFEITV